MYSRRYAVFAKNRSAADLFPIAAPIRDTGLQNNLGLELLSQQTIQLMSPHIAGMSPTRGRCALNL